MSDQITNCVQQNDINGNPTSYFFTYEFDSGTGSTTTQAILVDASSLDTPTDIAMALTLANQIAVSEKASWLTSINLPAPIQVTSVIGVVDLTQASS